MKRWLRAVPVALAAAAVLLMLLPSAAHAQDEAGRFFGMATASCVILALVWLAINIAILVWVAKDAQSRGSSAGAWIVIILIFGLLGLLAYLVARPQGKLVPCPNCQKMKPIRDVVCPHCGQRVV